MTINRYIIGYQKIAKVVMFKAKQYAIHTKTIIAKKSNTKKRKVTVSELQSKSLS